MTDTAREQLCIGLARSEGAGVLLVLFRPEQQVEIVAVLDSNTDQDVPALLRKAAGQIENGRIEKELPVRTVKNVRRCRVCGCTEDRACFSFSEGACHWVEYDLCSACVGK